MTSEQEHIRQAVALHRFADAAEWAAELAALAKLTEAEIEEIAAEKESGA